MDLHLLRSEELDPPLARLHGEGDGKVAKTKGQSFRYEPGEERVYINPDQYFEPVSQEVWEWLPVGISSFCVLRSDKKER